MFEIPAIPPTANQLMRRHWGWRAYRVKKWGDWMFASVSAYDNRLLLNTPGMRKISLTVFHSKLWDAADNAQSAYKAILDAGKNLGWWRDDSAEFVICAPVVQQHAPRKEARTRITIEVAE